LAELIFGSGSTDLEIYFTICTHDRDDVREAPGHTVAARLRNSPRHGEWNIQTDGKFMSEMDHIAKAMPHGNAVSLLAATSSEVMGQPPGGVLDSRNVVGSDRRVHVKNDACFFLCSRTIYSLFEKSIRSDFFGSSKTSQLQFKKLKV
jgi:hypothetical protein